MLHASSFSQCKHCWPAADQQSRKQSCCHSPSPAQSLIARRQGPRAMPSPNIHVYDVFLEHLLASKTRDPRDELPWKASMPWWSRLAVETCVCCPKPPTLLVSIRSFCWCCICKNTDFRFWSILESDLDVYICCLDCRLGVHLTKFWCNSSTGLSCFVIAGVLQCSLSLDSGLCSGGFVWQHKTSMSDFFWVWVILVPLSFSNAKQLCTNCVVATLLHQRFWLGCDLRLFYVGCCWCFWSWIYLFHVLCRWCRAFLMLLLWFGTSVASSSCYYYLLIVNLLHYLLLLLLLLFWCAVDVVHVMSLLWLLSLCVCVSRVILAWLMHLVLLFWQCCCTCHHCSCYCWFCFCSVWVAIAVILVGFWVSCF